LRRGGTLVASGFDEEQVDGVERALRRVGLAAVERVERDRWLAVAFRRPEEGKD
jgi:ribosomal protein L11 methylase PrmA